MSTAGLNITIGGNATQAVEAITNVERELKTLGTNAQQAGAEAKAGLDQAFSTVGIRSEQAIKAEIDAITGALHTMAASGTVTGDELQRAFVAAGKKIEVLQTEIQPIAPALGEIPPAAAAIGTALAAAFAVDKIAKLAVEFDSLSRAFKIITGDAKSAADEMKYVSRTAMKLGLDVSSAGNAWKDFSAATQGTVLAGQQARDIFEAVSGAMSQMGKSSAETNAVLNALTAMVNTGVVSMDALKTQLGTALPGALKIAADSLGITQGELVKLVESGKMLTVDLLPALAVGLKNAFKTDGEVGGLAAEWNRLTNTVKLSVEAISQAPAVMNSVGMAMTGLRLILARSAVIVSTLAEGITYLGQTIGTLAAVAATPLKLNDALADLSKKGIEAQQRIYALAVALGLAKPSTDALADAHNKLGAELNKGGTATAALTDEQKKQAAASAQAKESTAALTVHTEQANASFKNLTDAIRATTDIQKQHDQTAISAIAIAGQQKDVLQAEATAAGHAAESAQTLVNVKSASLAVAQRYLEGLQQEVIGLKEVDTKVQERIKLATEDVEKKQLEVGAAQAFAEAQALTAEKTTLATETLKDNSKRVGELRNAYNEATQALEIATQQHNAGKISNEAYAESVKNQRDALALYKDALNDAVTALKLKEEAEKRHIDLTVQGIGVQIESAKASQTVAKARGDETEAVKQGLLIKSLEADQAKAVAVGKDKEAKSFEETGNARIAEIKATGELTTEMKAEISAINDEIAAKKLEAQASKEAARAKKAESEAASSAARKAAEEGASAAQNADGWSQEEVAAHNKAVDALIAQQQAEYNLWNQKEIARVKSEQFQAVLKSLSQTTKEGTLSLSAAIDAAETYSHTLDSLDKQKLDQLNSAIASAKQQMESLKDSADSTLSSLQQELAQINGNYVKAEELRIASRKADLESQLAIARAQNNAAAENMLSQAIATLDQIASIKIAQARQQETDALAKTSQSSSQAASAAGQLGSAAQAASGAAQSVTLAAEQMATATQQTTTATRANQAANQAASTQLTTATQAASTAAQALGSVTTASVSMGGAAQQLEQAASLLSSSVSASNAASASPGSSSVRQDSSAGGERRTGEGGSGEVSSRETGRSPPENSPGNTDNSSYSGNSGNSPSPTANYTTNINIAGVLDLNDRATLESLTRKLSPIMADLMRKS